jgi:hypothetical protein
MINLLEETIEYLKRHNKTLKDVLFCGGNEYKFSVKKFKKLANIKYDNSYGTQIIARDLKVYGEDWWLERHEYNGAEWWEYKSFNNELPTKDKTPKALIGPKRKLGTLGYLDMEQIDHEYTQKTKNPKN